MIKDIIVNIQRDTGYLDQFKGYGDTMLSEFLGIFAIFILGIWDIFQNN